MKTLLKFFCCTLLISIVSCSSDNNVGPKLSDNYMSLSIGDIRQYYDEEMNNYQTWEIFGKTIREDGLEVFMGQWSSSLDSFNVGDTNYYAIHGEYFIATDLQRKENPQNPFNEQKLAKINPELGDQWLNIYEDSDSAKFTVSYLGNFKTVAGDFEEVYGFAIEDIMTVYYAKRFGHLGASSSGRDIKINYAKISGQEIGEYIPFKRNKYLEKKQDGGNIRKVNIIGQLF